MSILEDEVDVCDGSIDPSNTGKNNLNRQQSLYDFAPHQIRSLLGDGGMRDERVRVALESWNFCNRVGDEGGPDMPSPRHADCAQIICSSANSSFPHQQGSGCEVEQLVGLEDNVLKYGQAFPQEGFSDYTGPDDYAVQKELYLASLCKTESQAGPWHFWMIMLKNGNFDMHSGLCPSTAPSFPKGRPFMSNAATITSQPVANEDLDIPHLMPQMLRIPSLDKERQNEEFFNDATKSASPSSLTHVSHSSVHDINDATKLHTERPFALAAKKSAFPCFGEGCMNHPKIFHNWSSIHESAACAKTINGTLCDDEHMIGGPSLFGSFYGTYDLDDIGLANQTVSADSSYFSIDWSKDPQSGTWIFHHVLRVNHKYPWLMLYLRADATNGLSGGYPWETRGMMIKVPESPKFKVKLTLNVLRGGGSASQFYLLDIGGCWKNDGSECDGNTSSDVTRYSEMIINPNTGNACRPNVLSNCPLYHVDAKSKKRIYRNDTTHFPYTAYHYYCVPPNAKYAEKPYSVCDPYSNPQPQEIMQLLPHPEWAVHGYPSAKGQGWVGDPRTWTLDVGGLSQRLYFYQDPNTKPAQRKWTSVDVGTEIYISQNMETAEWIVSDFDIF
ncbi:hypothetical protein KP509_34G007900 [Ceratopteris richardii]|nr:hypothetical protein KP509_34G007900 [Ceratopteris richardii]